ncbi:MAG TPA: GntR family transcriptional regulator [Sandaracinaceae bacterium LLY-WYZ-13_1]|nr:GntR family transcriptional regulator [Sandaracinaceae bacterium LLY-WYZ-13_1]
MGPYREPGPAPTLVVDFDSHVPLYRQIADGVRALIARGVLTDGEALPSVRKLGGRLGVNLNTVAKAYRVLADERVVELKQGAPARVIVPPDRPEPLGDEARRELAGWVGRARLRGAAEADVREAFEETLLRFYGEGRGGET